MTEPRGIRNRNPGNIDYHPSSDPWQGLDEPPTDGRFCRFVDAEHGIRVMAKLLTAYQQYHGCDTVRKIISRWAPPNENDTIAYVAMVAKSCGVGPDEQMSVKGPHIMMALIKAIVQQENGQQPYADEVIDRGIAMAG